MREVTPTLIERRSSPGVPLPLCAVTYPPAFGEPPRMTTRDYRKLPFGYGYGSGTIAGWLTTRAQAVYGETAEEYHDEQ